MTAVVFGATEEYALPLRIEFFVLRRPVRQLDEEEINVK